MANESVNRTIQRESKMNFRIKYDILNGLTYEGYVNMNIRNTKGRMFCHRWLLVLHGQTKCQIVVRIPLLTY